MGGHQANSGRRLPEQVTQPLAGVEAQERPMVGAQAQDLLLRMQAWRGAELVEAAYCVAQVQPPALAIVQGDACVAQGVTGQGHHQ